MRRSMIAIGLLLFTTSILTSAEPDNSELARKAIAVLKAHCYRCHGQDGVFEGGMNYILDPAKLISHKKIVPGKPDESKLFLRVAKGSMPPVDQTDRPSAAEKETLRKWIAAGSPSLASAATSRRLISQADLYQWMLDDLNTMERRGRRFIRYFSLAHLYNQGLDADELQTYRNALSKLANSLSWHPRISVPVAVDPNKVLLRIDLRWYDWDANQWNRLLSEYPYGVIDDGVTARAVMVGTATRMPILRADWFIANACRPPLYFDMLQLPASLNELERQLRVDSAVDIQQERVVRLGFNGSGVSKNNRILERHDSVHGVYWRTYDFEAVPQNLVERGGLLPDQRNLFAYPLGPAGVAPHDPFLHAGGEAIFSLPNGLHGYMIVNAANNRIDKGAVQIVSDPKRPDRAVETGVSCMSCHLTGINPKTDQVRDSLAKNPKQFSRSEAELIRALYAPEGRTTKLMNEDIDRYRKAVEKTGAKVAKTEPVSTLTLRYEADVDLPGAAAEIGISTNELRQRIASSSVLTQNLGALIAPGGTVSRQVFVQAFADIVGALKLGTLFTTNASSGNLPDNTGDLDPLEGSAAQCNAVSFTSDGRLGVIAGADRSLRLWDVRAEREMRRFVGHTGSVWSVALSPDERTALSGGMDGTMRLWDLQTGQELRRFDGHLSLVSAVAFSADGRQVASGGYDGSIVLWDLHGNELSRFDHLPGQVQCLRFCPDGNHLIVACGKQVSEIAINGGAQSDARWSHDAAISSIALSPDGKLVAYGADDGNIIVRKRAPDEKICEFNIPNRTTVRDLEFAPSGKALLSAGADRIVRLWSIPEAKQIRQFDKHNDIVVRASFVDGGRRTLSASRDSIIKSWSLSDLESLLQTPNATTPDQSMPVSPRTGSKLIDASAVIAIGGTVGDLILSANGKRLICLDHAGGKLIQIDTVSLKSTRTLSLPVGCEKIELSRDGKSVWTIAGGKERCSIFEIDSELLTVRGRFDVDLAPYDFAVANDLIFVSGDSGGWSDISIVDTKRKSITARWGGVWTKSLVRVSPNGDRVYVSTQGVSPGKFEGYPIPLKLTEKPLPSIAAARPGVSLGGEFMLTPDGRFLVARSGATFRLAADREDDLQPTAKLPPHLGCTVDATSGVLLLLSQDGLSIERYSYPSLERQMTYRLKSMAHEMAFDGAKGRVYLSAIDARSHSHNRAKGHDDIHVLDLKDLQPNTR